MFILSSLVVVMATFINNSTAIIIIAACFGYVLSLDIFGLALQARDIISKEMSKHPVSQWRLKEIIIFIAMLLLTPVIAGVSQHFSSSASHEMFEAFGIAFVVLLILSKVLGDIQCVSIFFGLFRNPFYPASIEASGEFKKRKKNLRHAGLLHQTLLFYGEYCNTASVESCSAIYLLWFNFFSGSKIFKTSFKISNQFDYLKPTFIHCMNSGFLIGCMICTT